MINYSNEPLYATNYQKWLWYVRRIRATCKDIETMINTDNHTVHKRGIDIYMLAKIKLMQVGAWPANSRNFPKSSRVVNEISLACLDNVLASIYNLEMGNENEYNKDLV